MKNKELNSQFTNFIYPFICEENYVEIIRNMVIDNKCFKLEIDNFKNNEDLYSFYLPYMKKFLFPTLYLDKKIYNSYSINQKINYLKKQTCVTFKVNLKNTLNGIFNDVDFEICEIKFVLFEFGVCFCIINTELKNPKFNDVLDFNNEFRNIIFNEKIDVKNITTNRALRIIFDFVHKYETTRIDNRYYDKMFVYSYSCLDEQNLDKNNLINDFYNYEYVVKSDSTSTFNTEFINLNNNIYSRWKYSLFGFSKESLCVLCLAKEKYNITKLPISLKNKYLYMILFGLYQRIMLLRFSNALQNHNKDNIKKLSNRLNRFTHFSWFSVISNSENGMDIWKKIQNTFELKEIYSEVKNEYSEYYNYVNVGSQNKINVLLVMIYVISVIFSGMNLLLPVMDINNEIIYIISSVLMFIAVLIYPVYLIVKKIKHNIEKKMGGYL